MHFDGARLSEYEVKSYVLNYFFWKNSFGFGFLLVHFVMNLLGLGLLNSCYFANPLVNKYQLILELQIKTAYQRRGLVHHGQNSRSSTRALYWPTYVIFSLN